MQTQLPENIPTHLRERIPNAILPAQIQEAQRAVVKCLSLDESKFYADKADAWAAWAKVIKDRVIWADALRLKAYAYRRMNELAEELSPVGRNLGFAKGMAPGPVAKMVEAGLTITQARKARRIGSLPLDTFEEHVTKSNPPGITRLSMLGRGITGVNNQKARLSSDAWTTFAGVSATTMHANAAKFRSFCRRHSALELGRGINPGEIKAADTLADELIEWLLEYKASLPKADA